MTVRRLTAAVAGSLCLLAGVLTGPVDAQATPFPTLVGDRAVTVVEGEESWINLAWTAPARLDDFQVELLPTQRSSAIGYADGAGFASLSQDSTLSPGEMDVTSFSLTTPEGSARFVAVDVVATYTVGGKTTTVQAGQLAVRVIEPVDGPFAFLTDDATIASNGDGGSNWIEVDLFGMAPLTTDMRLTVAGGGPEVYYPQTTYTSLHHDSRLFHAEEDVARVWIDPDDVEPGTYTLVFVIEFDRDGVPARQSHGIRLTVV